MPWSSLESVPDNVKKHKGVELTLTQANWIAKVAKGAGEEGEENWAIAWSQFDNKYKKNEDGTGWIEKESESESKDLSKAQIFSMHLSIIGQERKTGQPFRVNIEACMEGEGKVYVGGGKTRNFKITEKDIDSIINNFNKNVVGYDVFVDRMHMGEDPFIAPSPEFTEKLGRVMRLWKGESENPATLGRKILCATLELNPTGERLILEGAYGYSSVVLWRKWIDVNTNKPVKGAVISSIAFTNSPVVAHLKRLGEPVPEPEEELTSAIAASRWTAVLDGAVFLSQDRISTNRQGGKMPKKQTSPKRELYTVVEGTSMTNLEELIRSKPSEVESLGEDGYISWPFDLLETEPLLRYPLPYGHGWKVTIHGHPWIERLIPR